MVEPVKEKMMEDLSHTPAPVQEKSEEGLIQEILCKNRGFGGLK